MNVGYYGYVVRKNLELRWWVGGSVIYKWLVGEEHRVWQRNNLAKVLTVQKNLTWIRVVMSILSFYRYLVNITSIKAFAKVTSKNLMNWQEVSESNGNLKYQYKCLKKYTESKI